MSGRAEGSGGPSAARLEARAWSARGRWRAARARAGWLARGWGAASGHGGRCYHGRRVIFVDYLGPADGLARVREVVGREVGAAMRVPATQVSVRRIVTEDARPDVELWIELSTDEQLYRLGRDIAQRVSAALRPDDAGPDVWVDVPRRAAHPRVPERSGARARHVQPRLKCQDGPHMGQDRSTAWVRAKVHAMREGASPRQERGVRVYGMRGGRESTG